MIAFLYPEDFLGFFAPLQSGRQTPLPFTQGVPVVVRESDVLRHEGQACRFRAAARRVPLSILRAAAPTITDDEYYALLRSGSLVFLDLTVEGAELEARPEPMHPHLGAFFMDIHFEAASRDALPEVVASLTEAIRLRFGAPPTATGTLASFNAQGQPFSLESLSFGAANALLGRDIPYLSIEIPVALQDATGSAAVRTMIAGLKSDLAKRVVNNGEVVENSVSLDLKFDYTSPESLPMLLDPRGSRGDLVVPELVRSWLAHQT